MTSIQPNGMWIAAVTTGGDDKRESEVNAYRVPSNFSIPLLSGSRTIPASFHLVFVPKRFTDDFRFFQQ